MANVLQSIMRDKVAGISAIYDITSASCSNCMGLNMTPYHKPQWQITKCQVKITAEVLLWYVQVVSACFISCVRWSS